MLYDEFCKLVDADVDYDYYKEVIEPMYMALPDRFSKQDFVHMLNPAIFKKNSDVDPTFRKAVAMYNREAFIAAKHCYNDDAVNALEHDSSAQVLADLIMDSAHENGYYYAYTGVTFNNLPNDQYESLTCDFITY